MDDGIIEVVLLDYISDILLSEQNRQQEVSDMKGYMTASGYMGLVEGRYILFASEEDYREFLEAA